MSSFETAAAPHPAEQTCPDSSSAAGRLPQIDFQRLVRVEEYDLDRSGLAITAMYARWMEETEYGFLRSRELCVSQTDERGRYGFPRLHVAWEIQSPARRGDELRVGLWLGGTDGKRLRYRFVIERRPTGLTGELTSAPAGGVGGQISGGWEACASGEFVMACCRFPAEALPYAIPIPEMVLQKLGLEPG